jgi:hypothetical protein
MSTKPLEIVPRLLYAKVFKVYYEGVFMEKEVSTMSLHADYKSEVIAMAHEFMEVSMALARETGNLSDLLIFYPKDFSPEKQECAPVKAAVEKIYEGLNGPIKKMHELTDRLQILADQDNKFSLVVCLCQSVGTQILKANIAIMDLLDGLIICMKSG